MLTTWLQAPPLRPFLQYPEPPSVGARLNEKYPPRASLKTGTARRGSSAPCIASMRPLQVQVSCPRRTHAQRAGTVQGTPKGCRRAPVSYTHLRAHETD